MGNIVYKADKDGNRLSDNATGRFTNNQDATDDEPEFRSMNDAYLALYDSAKRTEYVDRAEK